jgi:hypothetical protein
MPLTYKQRVANLKKGRETQKINKELNKVKKEQEKQKLSKMSLVDLQNYKHEKEYKEYKKARKGLKSVIGTRDPLEKFKTSDDTNISIRKSNAKNTLIIDVAPDPYSKKYYSRSYVKKFGSKLSNYLHDIGIDGKIQLETNFTDKGHLYKSGQEVELGHNPDLFQENELSYIVKQDDKTQIKSFDKFNGMRYFVRVDKVNNVKSKLKNYK